MAKASAPCPPAMPAPSKTEADYRAEDDHRTLTRAAEVQADPARMAGVKKQHRKLTQSVAAVGRSLSVRGGR